MTLLSTIWFSGMSDIMVMPEIISAIALWVKSKMATITAKLSDINYHHSRQNGPQSIILMSTIGFSGIPGIVCGWKVHWTLHYG